MAKTRFIILNAQQISEHIHDYIAENGRELCLDKSINETGSFIKLDKNNVRALCLFSKNNSLIADKEALLERLPYSAFRCFVLTNKQIIDIVKRNEVLRVEDLYFAPTDKCERIKKNSMRLMTLNEADMKWILYKQLLKFFDCKSEIEGNCLNAGMQIDFTGEDSRALFYYGSKSSDFNFEKISDLPCKMIEYWNLRYVDVNNSDIKKYLKESE